MNGSNRPPPLEDLKRQAKRLRAELTEAGTEISHSRSLELVAHQYGYKDWNCIHAAVGNQPPVCPVSIGQRVRGTYLGQSFEGEVLGVQMLKPTDRFHVTLWFDEAVDVVKFDGLSNWRRRVGGTIALDGRTIEKTTNGEPHLCIQLDAANR